MSEKKVVRKDQSLRRRDFLSQSAAAGGVAVIGSVAAGPMGAIAETLGVTVDDESSATHYQHVPSSPGSVSLEKFSGHVGESFRLRQVDGKMLRAKLIEANALPYPVSNGRRQQFSLIFDLPNSDEIEQGHYWVGHSRLGQMEFFMSPVDLPQKFRRLEAILA